MTERAERGVGDGRPVTPPHDEPGRPGLVTAAVALWALLGVLLIGTALLFVLALIVPSADPGSGALPVIGAIVLLAAAGVGTVVCARLLRHGSRRARTVLTVLGSVLAVVGLVQVTFRGVGGSWFVAFLVAVVLLHLPAARAYFARDGR